MRAPLPTQPALEAPGSANDRALRRLRARIDELNRAVLELLQQRSTVVLEIGEVKHASGHQTHDPWREAEMLRALTSDEPGPLSATEVKEIFETIFAVSVKLQRRAASARASQGRENDARDRH